MALIECPECKKQVSDKAPTCPQCGAPIATIPSPSPTTTEPIKKRSGTHPFLIVLIVLIVGISFWYWRASTNIRVAPPSAGLSGLIRQPQKLVDERMELKEGQFFSSSFTLKSDARVQVQVDAAPKNVDVMLMTKEQYGKFQDVSSGNITGGQYTFKQGLSSKQVLQTDKTELLTAGDWVIVVMRPKEALLFQDATSANVAVTVY